ncbi:NUDIX domain-containing protein [Streptomyces sp. ODS28]|uniref:NUDIX domain-containing protein n=1 Tax=Streptomyces sp. ODS28 TaxID=3136688 RepID=UPI0031F1537E
MSAAGIPATASVLLTDPGGRLLLVRSRHRLRSWHLPGGLVEEGESPRRAARREAREELGLQCVRGGCWRWSGSPHVRLPAAPGSPSSSPGPC